MKILREQFLFSVSFYIRAKKINTILDKRKVIVCTSYSFWSRKNCWIQNKDKYHWNRANSFTKKEIIISINYPKNIKYIQIKKCIIVKHGCFSNRSHQRETEPLHMKRKTRRCCNKWAFTIARSIAFGFFDILTSVSGRTPFQDFDFFARLRSLYSIWFANDIQPQCSISKSDISSRERKRNTKKQKE